MFDDKLDNQEIKKRILENKYPSGFRPSENLVKSILDQFWFHDFYNSFIADEVYLGWLLEYLDKERQRRNFNLEKITNLYNDILEIDFKIKSGLCPYQVFFLEK